MKKPCAVAAIIMAASPALAHHPLAGAPMVTLGQGMLSGLGHPVLGFDHLFFVIAMGIAARFTPRPMLTPAGYVAAMLLGCGLMYAGLGLPLKEAVIALSLLVLGGVILSGRALTTGGAIAIFAGFGLFHGSAFGDTLAAQEGGAGVPVLIGYLIGLGLVQYAIAFAAGHAAGKFPGATQADAINARLAGAMITGIGLFLCLEAIETPVLAMIAG